MKNKILSLVLALLMAASSASAVLADDVVAISEEPEVVEAVVEETEVGEYDKAIEFLANYGIFKGYSADDTGAEDLIERYQMALFVARVATGWTNDEVWENGKDQWTNFSDIDVDPVNKYFGALSFAAQNKIIEGYGNGKFGPQDNINYQNALTMVVRTLGYTGLEWPWGYIQKAVELGLTDGISGVAYTDDLTRGEVAQIIYNAMFAKMKDGSNLALKNFGIEFGWEKVVITASNLNTFVKTNDATGVESKYVEFRLLNDDGSLGEDAYKTYASSFDLDVDKHEDELAVGKAYYVLFEKDADSELADIVAVEDLYLETKVNSGKTDDEADDQEYEIKEFFKEYTLVTKYSENNYLNITATDLPEVMVWDKVGGITVKEVAGHYIGIDWETGDILAPEYKDGKPVDANKDEKIDVNDYVVAWYRWDVEGKYSQERYYKQVKNSKGEIIGIEWMTEADFEEFYKSVAYEAEKSYKGFTALGSITTDRAYAELDLFDTNLDGIADRGLYEEFTLGYFKTKTEGAKCSDCDKYYDTWNITAVGTVEKSVGESAPTKVNVIPEGTCTHTAYSNGWFAEGYEPNVDEDGEYVDGYVIYSYDDETKGIKIVKTIEDIEDADDEDSYVATGVLRAYNTAKETVTIGEDKLTMNYDNLLGTGFEKVSDNKAKYDHILYKYFNQFVKYVVVDGELVHIEAIGTDTNDVIVVTSYAGLSNDGYVVVNGYKTDDLKYTQFRLASIEGWKEGDIYYYADNYEGFDNHGMVLSISSYDEENDVYFVEYFAGYDVEDGEYEIEGEMTDRIAYESDGKYLTKFVWDETKARKNYDKCQVDHDHWAVDCQNYKWEKGDWVEDGFVKMTDGDEYILVPSYGFEYFAPVAVWEGKLPEGAWIEGERIKKTDDNTFVFVKAEWNGFMSAYDTGLVVLLDKDFEHVDYNGEDAEDWYLLGAVEYEVRVFDVFTGEFDALRYAENKNFDVKEAYLTYGNVMVEDGGLNGYGLIDMINHIGNYAWYDASDYLVRSITLIEDGEFAVVAEEDDGGNIKDDVTAKDLYATDKDAHLAAFEKVLVAHESGYLGDYKFRGDKVKGITYREITIDEDGDIVSITKDYEGDKTAEKFSKLQKTYTNLEGFYVYNKETSKVVVYIVINEEEYNTVVAKDNTAGTIELDGFVKYDNDSKNDKDPLIVRDFEAINGDEAYIAAKVGYSYDTVNGDITAVTVKDITLSFAGDYITGNKKEGIKAADVTKDTFAYYWTETKAADVTVTIDHKGVDVKTVTGTAYADAATKYQTLKIDLDVDEDFDSIGGYGTYLVTVEFRGLVYKFQIDVVNNAVVDYNIVENVIVAY